MSNRWQASATYLLSGQWNLQNAPAAGAWLRRTRRRSPPTGAPTCDVPVTLHPRSWRSGTCSGDQRQSLHVQRHLADRRTASRSAVSTSTATRAGRRPAPAWTRSQRAARAAASARTARSSRATASTSRRSTAWTCGCSGSSVSAARPPSTASSKCSTCSTTRTTPSFTTNETSARYGQPTESLNISYQPRMLQFGFRASF